MIGSRQYALLKTLLLNGARASTEFEKMDVAPASLHKTLFTLQRRGLVKSHFSEPRHMRGGKARRMFSITSKGKKAVGSYEHTFDQ